MRGGGNADCRQEHRDNKQEGETRPGISNIDGAPSEEGLHRVESRAKGQCCPHPSSAMRARHLAPLWVRMRGHRLESFFSEVFMHFKKLVPVHLP